MTSIIVTFYVGLDLAWFRLTVHIYYTINRRVFGQEFLLMVHIYYNISGVIARPTDFYDMA